MGWGELVESGSWMVDVLLLKERGGNLCLGSRGHTVYKLCTDWEAIWEPSNVLKISKGHSSR